jgi:PAS domain-containing protein
VETGQDRNCRSETSADRMITAMRETAARLNGIIQSTMDAIITVDGRQDIMIFNPAAEHMFGCQAADVIGTPLEQFIPSRHGKGIDAAVEGERKTFGLLGMRERAGMLGGELTVQSSPGAGTPVVMTIPRTAQQGWASQ